VDQADAGTPAAHGLQRIAAAKGRVAGVQAEADAIGISGFQQTLHLSRVLNVGAAVGVEADRQAQVPATVGRLVKSLHKGPPLVGRHAPDGRFAGPPGDGLAHLVALIGQQDVLGAQGRQEARHLVDRLEGSGMRLPLPEIDRHEGRDHRELAPGELLPQHGRVHGQVARGPQLRPCKARGGHLIQHFGPRLLRAPAGDLANAPSDGG